MNILSESDVRTAIKNNDSSNIDVYYVYVYSITYDIRRVAMAKGLSNQDLRTITNSLERDLYYAFDHDLDGGVYEKSYDVKYSNMMSDSDINDCKYYVSLDANNRLTLEKI
jgi:hypothetical protein